MVAAVANSVPIMIDNIFNNLSALVYIIAPNIKKNIELSSEDCEEYDFIFISMLNLFSMFSLYNNVNVFINKLCFVCYNRIDNKGVCLC